ncbi:GbsR/MarR family transcriptional regulator [Afifella sp. IM 167]|uniref:GbsR/MarR family transcriptional regulator n=1 Tax=Afifella sp. IM 167 TaxID=2033586 RepID=UPI001CCB88C8|nr:MarR family transcriptional regulator [Afifella sp. IM 167]MBZ8133308.1 ArsR family transcriptional regulator [Afifella sp. IM 167]
MRVTPVMEKFILHWGEMGSRWGVNRSVAQIHALLYLAARPMPAEEISEALAVARSNVSNSLKELQAYRLISVTHVKGDRRDHFSAEADPWEIMLRIAEERKRREIDPALSMLRDCVMEAEEAEDTDPAVRERLTAMLSFLDELTGWYEQVRRLPRATLVAIVRLGGKVGSLVRR